MKIQVSRAALLHALAAADGIARPNQMPLLECVLISAHGKGAARVDATDLSMTISAELESDTSKEGSIAINAKLLRDVIKNAADGVVSLTVLDNQWVEIKCGKAKHKLAAFAPRDFPKIAKPNGAPCTTFDGAGLKLMIDRVLFSASEDKSRAHLNGALFASDRTLAMMVTTDGHRLSRATCANGGMFSAIVPKESLAKIARIVDGPTEITFEGGRMFVRSGDVVLSTGLIEGVFPQIAQVIPSTFTHEVTIDRDALIASIERTKITTTETRGMLIDGRKDSLVMSSRNPDVGEASDEVTAEGADGLATCVASKYLLDPLSKITDDTVKLKIAGELYPVVLEAASSSDYLAVIMPMRRD